MEFRRHPPQAFSGRAMEFVHPQVLAQSARRLSPELHSRGLTRLGCGVPSAELQARCWNRQNQYGFASPRTQRRTRPRACERTPGGPRSSPSSMDSARAWAAGRASRLSASAQFGLVASRVLELQVDCRRLISPVLGRTRPLMYLQTLERLQARGDETGRFRPPRIRRPPTPPGSGNTWLRTSARSCIAPK